MPRKLSGKTKFSMASCILYSGRFISILSFCSKKPCYWNCQETKQSSIEINVSKPGYLPEKLKQSEEEHESMKRGSGWLLFKMEKMAEYDSTSTTFGERSHKIGNEWQQMTGEHF